VAEVDVRQLDDRKVAELVFGAQESEMVLVAAAPLECGRIRQQHARLPDQVERHVGERDVLLDHRSVAAPLGNPLAEDQ
jgi:hypothetical protein